MSILTVDDIQLILDKIGRETVVHSSDSFKFDVVTQSARGYHSDPKIGALQAKLSMMLEVASR